MQYVVETIYNTDAKGKWVDFDDHSNRTLHGPFDTEADADEFMSTFLEDDTDVKDMTRICINPPDIRETDIGDMFGNPLDTFPTIRPKED